jgi:hypothetical protein
MIEVKKNDKIEWDFVNGDIFGNPKSLLYT